jgi:prevent-host-death family protein
MRTVGIFEAKQKLSELVDRASRGERIRITRRGKVAAEIGPAQAQEKHDLQDIKGLFAGMERIRKRAKPLPPGVTIKDLIEEGRR